MLDKILRLFRAAWAPLAVVLGHGAAASLFGHPRELDPVLHFLGGAAVAYFLCHGSEIIAPILGPLTLFARLALAFTGACTVALFWELGEFLSDTYLGTYVQGGLTDTIVDLLLGVGGAAVFVLAHLLVTTRFMQAVLSRIESDRVAAPEDAV